MFAGMSQYFINQLKFSKSFYLTQYPGINHASQKAIKRNSFGKMIDIYMQCLVSGDMSPLETESGRSIRKKVEECAKITPVKRDDDTYFTIAINKNKINTRTNEVNIRKASLEFDKAVQMMEIHNNNAIMSLLVRFENFFHDYFKWLIQKYPDKYLNDKSIPFSELVKYNYDDMRSKLVTDTADEIMYEPMSEWLKILASHKIDLSPLGKYLKSFEEVYYRRNIIVHNNGKVNRQYLSAVYPAEEGPAVDTKLTPNKEYIINAFDTAMIIIYGILYESLKCQNEDREGFVEYMFNAGFEHMMESEWAVSRFIFNLLLGDKTQDAIKQVLSRINYWLSMKSLGRYEEIKDEIEKADFSAMTSSIKMGKALLLENFEEAIPLMDEAIMANELTPDLVETWPIFYQFRKTEYHTAFQERYSEPLKSQTIPGEDVEGKLNSPQEILDAKRSLTGPEEPEDRAETID